MEGSSECEFLSALAVATTATASSSSQYESAEDIKSMVDSESLSTSMLEERIEASKWHWSELSDSDRSLSGEEVAADNMEVFRTLQSHPEWGHLFWTFNDGAVGTLVVGEKFAEGGQAELYNAHVTFDYPQAQQYLLDSKTKFALKVFKEGTSLRDLERQWPKGFLNWKRDANNRGSNQILSTPSSFYYNTPWCGTMLEGGRFAFLMVLRREDLQSLIGRRMHDGELSCAPFSKEESDVIMYKLALGVLWLHEHDVVHRDIKAANVLIGFQGSSTLGDYECSIGVVGTGYWRAPEILQACKDGIVSQKEELFTKAADVYSYAMTCYEILTGKGPFEGEMVTMESVIGGQRPTLPIFVDKWAEQLLLRCWDTSPSARPSIQEILTIIASNTNIQWIKNADVVRKTTNVTDVEEFQLEWDNPLHTFTRLESGIFKTCVLCFEACNESSIKCTTCIDYYLHSRCATLEYRLFSVIHPHGLSRHVSYGMGDQKRICDGCQLDIVAEYWYRCIVEECDFDMHLLCAKYVGRISNPLHKEHKLILSSSSSCMSLKDASITCECCLVELNPMEFVYHCEECAFSIHPKCAAPHLQVHRG